MRDLASLSAADFELAVGSAFEVVAGDLDPMVLRLTDVVSLGEPPPGRRGPFSLRFRGPRSPTLAQRTYHIVHAEMDDLDIFLGPIASDAHGTTYEAVFA